MVLVSLLSKYKPSGEKPLDSCSCCNVWLVLLCGVDGLLCLVLTLSVGWTLLRWLGLLLKSHSMLLCFVVGGGACNRVTVGWWDRAVRGCPVVGVTDLMGSVRVVLIGGSLVLGCWVGT